jgi:ribonuclease P protein component
VVVYVVPRAGADLVQGCPPADVQVGFVVGKAVGNSVIRHRVLRQLRSQVASRLDGVAGAQSMVVRALPSAASATTADLGSQLDRALRKARST